MKKNPNVWRDCVFAVTDRREAPLVRAPLDLWDCMDGSQLEDNMDTTGQLQLPNVAGLYRAHVELWSNAHIGESEDWTLRLSDVQPISTLEPAIGQ